MLIKLGVSKIGILRRIATVFFTLSIYCILFFFPSCEKDEEEIVGCTDPAATNYNPKATKSSNSCIYPVRPATQPPNPSPGNQPPATVCRTEQANLVPINLPPFSCGTPGPITVAILNDINSLWQSQIQACACGSDFPQCANNAVALDFRIGGRAYIFYDRNILSFLGSNGSNLGPAWFLAHEAGHNIQNEVGYQPPTVIQKELGADCLAGYFIGYLVCNNKVNNNDISSAFMSICATGDPFTPWFNPQGHGNCQQRQQATLVGLTAYRNGQRPFPACNF